ncbi:hypothetical protein BGZ60DRAFT_242558 [Tricladium varicosporioides]|nr:hypothetical protein BGZ60DRAFT_242558 [Hymenoscyphus varicosporioides]
MEMDFPSLSLAFALIVSTYIAFLCYTPPTPPPSKPHPKDRLATFSDLTSRNKRRIFPRILLSAYHISLILFPTQREKICFHPELLNEKLFTWSWRTITYLLVVFTFGTIRIYAYSYLGKNFTFRLATPTKLETTGIYKYVQHPSYTGLLAVSSASTFLFERIDGGFACFLPHWLLWTTRIRGLSEMGWLGVTVTTAGFFWLRVVDEEEMLKKEFGREWEVWHAKTKRFIPGVI